MGRRAVNRDKIVDAALQLFVERGIDGSSTRALAERAGVAEASIYRYFESKEVMALQLYLEALAEQMAALNAAPDQPAGGAERLQKLLQAFLQHAAGNSQRTAYLILCEPRLAQQLPARVPGLAAPFQCLFREAGSRDPELAAALVWGGLSRVFLEYREQQREAELPALGRSLAEALWTMSGGVGHG